MIDFSARVVRLCTLTNLGGNTLKKACLVLALALGLTAISSVAQPQPTYAATKKQSSLAESIRYYEKQVAILRQKIEIIKSKQDRYAKSSPEYRKLVQQEIDMLKKIVYYNNQMIKLIESTRK